MAEPGKNRRLGGFPLGALLPGCATIAEDVQLNHQEPAGMNRKFAGFPMLPGCVGIPSEEEGFTSVIADEGVRPHATVTREGRVRRVDTPAVFEFYRRVEHPLGIR